MGRWVGIGQGIRLYIYSRWWRRDDGRKVKRYGTYYVGKQTGKQIGEPVTVHVHS